MAWSVDRLGRSLQDLVKFLSEIHALKVDLYLHQQGLDATTPAGKAMFQMMGVFAEFERAMIQERVRAGLARAKAEGKQLGRPKVDEKTENAIRKALGRKDRPGILKIAKELGVGTSTVQRIAAEHRGSASGALQTRRSAPTRAGEVPARWRNGGANFALHPSIDPCLNSEVPRERVKRTGRDDDPRLIEPVAAHA
jgi:DNA invertase Pin-like site-specific DNA recombinase